MTQTRSTGSECPVSGLPKLSDQRGFTLIEVLIAIMVFSIVGVAMMRLTRRMIVARRAVKERSETIAQIHRTLSTLRSDLASVQNFAIAPLYGDADSLGFPVAREAAPGVQTPAYLTYYLERAEKSSSAQLMRAIRNFHGRGKKELLLSGVAELEWRYLKVEPEGIEEVDRWSDPRALPAAVRARIHISGIREPVEILCPIRASSNRQDDETDS